MIEKPKKERRFLKILGKVGEILVQELLIKVGKSLVQKIGGKKTLPSIIFLSLFYNIAFASIDSIPYPITGNKQRLGWQTTGNGLVYRGRSNDTITKPTNYVDKNVKAYLILDSVRGTIFVWRQTYWDSLLVRGGGLTMPFDSITFNTTKDGTVGVGEVEYNDTQGSLIQGLKGGNVTNVIGQQLHQRVNNRTGAPLAKGDVVYLSGSQGNRITVAKALATSDPTSANTFGIVAESIADNASGYIITEGLITNLNTSALTQDSAVYLSGTTAGALTSTKPQAPIHGVYIGVCVKSNAGSGEIFVKIRNGQELDELHDVQITSPVNNASLYYKSSQGLWRDTTAALLVSDTAAMLANYSLKVYVDSIAQNFQDSIDEITNGYFKQEFISVTKDTLNWTKPVQLPIGGSNLLLVYRNGQMINDAQYSVIDTNKVKINSSSYKLGENYTVVYVKGGGGSGSGGVPFDTSVLNLQARLDLKLSISDTAAMLANYATKAYADTTGRFYARQDFSNVSSSTLIWTQSDTLVTGGVNVVQVYRNGQILLPSQYTIPSSTSVVIAAKSYKDGENYTVIYPRGGGAGSGGGSGSLTSISAGTGITVSPNPITTTGTVSADLSVLMELTDTSLLNLTSRFATKQNTLVSGTNIKTVNSNSLLGSGNISVGTLVEADTVSLSNRINTKLNSTDTASLSNRINLKLNATDTASLSNRINAKGNGTVTSVATGYGLTGGTITTTGTLLLDSAVVFSRIRDSIVDVAIGNDTIKILKQEYAPATSSVLTWTVTPKFPIQLKAYILVFRNGQLLINDQYNLTDTNKITIVSNSFKSGANYTIVTVSGIGSVGTGVFPNPVYPEAGIAVSTGSTWASSIPNNSSNWNTAYNDKINSLAVTGTTTKTITLTQQDGGTVSGNFTDNGSVTSVDMTVPTGLSISGNPITTNGTLALSYASGYSLPTDANQNNWTIAYNDKIASLAFTGTSTKTLTLNQTDGGTVSNTFTDLQGVTSVTAGTGLTGGTITSTGTVAVDFTTVAPLASPTFTGTVSGITKSMVGLGNVDNTSDANKPVSTATQTALNLKVNISDTASMLTPYFRDTDTTSLNLTSRFNTKQNTLTGTGFVKATGTTISYDNSTYLTTGTAAATYQTILTNPVTGTGTTNTLPLFTGASTLGNSVIQQSSNNIGINTTPYASLTMGQGKNIMLDASSNNIPKILFYETNARNENDVQFGAKIQYNSPSDKLEFVMRDSFAADPSGDELAISIVRQTGNTTIHKTLDVTGATTLGSTLAVTGNITEAGNNVLTNLDTISLSNRINLKLNATDTASLSNRINSKLNISDTLSMLSPYFRDADTTSLNLTSRFNTKLNLSDTLNMLVPYLRKADTTNMLLPYFRDADTTSLNLTSRFNTKLNLSDTLNMLVPYLRKADTTNMLLPYFRDADTTSLNLTSRFNTKQNTLNGTGFVKATGTSITYDNSTYLTTGTAASTYLPLTGGTLTGKLSVLDSISIGSLSQYTGNFTRYLKTANVSPYIDLNIGSVGTIGTWRGRINFQTSYNTETPTTAMTINEFGNINMNGTLGVTGATTLSAPLTVNSSAVFNEGSTDSDFRVESDGNANMLFVDASTDRVGIGTNAPTKTLDVNGEVKIATTTATPSSLLGKDGSNVVGEVTTVAQTGLMTRGETTATTGTPSATFTVTHGLGSTPTSILVTSAGLAGAEKIIFEVYTKNSTTFSVQAWNYDGTEASSKSVKIFWLAIK